MFTGGFEPVDGGSREDYGCLQVRLEFIALISPALLGKLKEEARTGYRMSPRK
jgi:hypothetical protein